MIKESYYYYSGDLDTGTWPSQIQDKRSYHRPRGGQRSCSSQVVVHDKPNAHFNKSVFSRVPCLLLTPAMQQSIYISWLQGPQQQTCSSGGRIGQTYYAGSAINRSSSSKVVIRHTDTADRLLYSATKVRGRQQIESRQLRPVMMLTNIQEGPFHWQDASWKSWRKQFFGVANCKDYRYVVLRKIIKIVATRCHILKLKCAKFDFRPRWKAYIAPHTLSWI